MEKEQQKMRVQPPMVKIPVRCPECLKLFSVDAYNIKEAKPRFSCNKCESIFWITYPDCLGHGEIIGYPDKWLPTYNAAQNGSAFIEKERDVGTSGELSPPVKTYESVAIESQKPNKAQSAQVVQERLNVKMRARDLLPPSKPFHREEVTSAALERFHKSRQEPLALKIKPESISNLEETLKPVVSCPNCEKNTPAGRADCTHCGVIIDKAKKKSQDPHWYTASRELKELWVKVLDDYENHELHHQFIRECRNEKNLEFSTSRYSRILESHPKDDIANIYKLEILALVSFATSRPLQQEKVKRKIRLPFVPIVLFLCGILIGIGYVLPEFRNLVGIGTSALFLTLAIKIYFR